MKTHIPISFANEEWILHFQRALYSPKRKMVIISDLHIGKSAHFRQHGIAIPQSVFKKDMAILNSLLQEWEVEKLLIVGDLIHAGLNADLKYFTSWRQQFPKTEFLLIKGNHDRIADSLLHEIGIEQIHNHFSIDNLHFVHEPIANAENHQFYISGHIHPGTTLQLPTKRKMSFPCFIIGQQQIVLPAFSQFTGLDTKFSLANAQKYLCLPEGIIEL